MQIKSEKLIHGDVLSTSGASVSSNTQTDENEKSTKNYEQAEKYNSTKTYPLSTHESIINQSLQGGTKIHKKILQSIIQIFRVAQSLQEDQSISQLNSRNKPTESIQFQI